MSRRKQTNPRAIKRDASQDDDDTLPSVVKKPASESTRSNSIDSKCSSIKCDSCQESFQTSEQFNQHRLYQCSFLFPEGTNSDESQTSSYDDYPQQLDTISFGITQNEEYSHTCSYCHKSFSNMALLLKHEQIHVELMPFRCSFCGKGFKHRRSLNRHLKLHTGERKFKCTLCESTFARSDHLKAHIRTHNHNNNNVDKTSQLDFRSKTCNSSEEQKHSSENKSNKDDKKTEHCPYCPRVCLGEDSLRSHIQIEHSQMPSDESKSESQSPTSSDTYCHLCNAKFNNRENFYAHIRCTHPLFYPKLDQISSLSNYSSKMSSDSIFNEYALIERTIWCEKCQRSFDSMATYLQHYSFQHCLQIIKCLQCQDVFETVELFFNHIERTHPSKTVETLKCKLCNGTYKQRSDFIHHIQTVHKTALYSCSLCSCQMTSTNELIEHLKLTHKIQQNLDLHFPKPSFNPLFTCQICSKKFQTRFDLNQHSLSEHNEDKKDSNEKSSLSNSLTCSSCDLTFPSEHLLIEHTKHVHRSTATTSTSFQCIYCHAIFTSRTQLDRHSRIHIASSGNNLKCNICDRLFSTIDILSEHKLSHCKATSSNICSYCHEVLTTELDYTRHLYDHNHLNTAKIKLNVFSTNHDTTPVTISCIICKQSLINEHEINLHMKFHLKENFTLTCQQCQKTTTTDRNYLIDLSTFNLICFHCIDKDFKCSDKTENDEKSKVFSCPKCSTNTEFDSIQAYQQHCNSIHPTKQSTDEYHCLKCNKIVFSHDHIHEHQIQRTSAFLIDTIDSRCSSPPSVHHCYLCRTNFDTPIKMHIHLIEHQYPHRDYQCSLCQQKSFDDASQLYHHMVQHGSKARLHPCRECDIYFMFSMHLINHQYSHDEDPKIKSIKKPSKSISNNDDEEKDICKSMVTRSATKRTCRSVIVN